MTSTQVKQLWQIDPSHTVAEFAVKHLMIATVKGRFRNIEGRLHLDEAAPDRSWVEATIDAASIDTADPERDAHLRSADFFDVDRFPAMTFSSKTVERLNEDRWRVHGDLTIRDVTREVVLDTEFEGESVGMDGSRRAAFTAETTINRKDYDLNWNVALEAGGVLVGEKVKITLHVAAILA